MKNKLILEIVRILFFNSMISGYSFSQWIEPVEVSPIYKGYSRQPCISVGKTSIMVAWREGFDKTDTVAELFSREFKNSRWDDIKSINKVKSNADNLFIAADNYGNFHTIWSERTIYKTPLPFQPPTDVFYSKCTDSGWNKAERIYYRPDSSFNYLIGFQILTDSKNKIHAIWSDFKHELLYHRIADNNIWQDSLVSVFSAAYIDIAIDKNDVIYAVYITGTLGGSRDVNSVFYRFSNDFGKTWSDPVLVSRSGNYPAFDVKIARDGNGTLHIIWTKQINPPYSYIRDDLYHSYSLDGIKWSTAKSIVYPLKGSFSTPNIVCDSKNNLHLVYDYRPNYTNPPFHLYYMNFINDKWSSPSSILNYEYCTESRLCIDKSDFLHISFNRINVGSDTSKQVCYVHTIDPVTLIKGQKNIPATFLLNQNYPNPFNPTTLISYSIPVDGKVKLSVFDLLGREVSILENGYKSAGYYERHFDANSLASGAYIYRLEFSPRFGNKNIIHQRIMQVIK